MGTWDIGPFDNDAAADWCGDLEDAEPDERIDLIRETLEEVAERHEYLDIAEAEVAIAAAAVVASQLPGARPVTSTYAPDFLRAGERLDVTPQLRRLADRALKRVLGEHSEWVELWEEADEDSAGAAFDTVKALRAALD